MSNPLRHQDIHHHIIGSTQNFITGLVTTQQNEKERRSTEPESPHIHTNIIFFKFRITLE